MKSIHIQSRSFGVANILNPDSRTVRVEPNENWKTKETPCWSWFFGRAISTQDSRSEFRIKFSKTVNNQLEDARLQSLKIWTANSFPFTLWNRFRMTANIVRCWQCGWLAGTPSLGGWTIWTCNMEERFFDEEYWRVWISHHDFVDTASARGISMWVIGFSSDSVR